MCANPMSDMFVHNPNFNLTSFEHLDKYFSAARRQNVGDKIKSETSSNLYKTGI